LDEFSKQIADALPAVKRFAVSLTKSPEDADELTQTVLEKALRKRHQWQPGSALKSWLFRIAQTTWIDTKRGEQVREAYAQNVQNLSAVRSVDGSASAENSILLSELERAILLLSEEHRSVIALVCIEGLSYRDAADVMECPVGTLTSRLTRARAALHEIMFQPNAGKVRRNG